MKLSIIVTCYNIAPYIHKCLDSIISQSLKDIEIIVVDDASNDGTKEIIEEYKARDTRIKTVFFETNTIGGVSSAANAGIDIAQGEFIGFADGDDWYELDMFEKLVNLAEQDGSDVAFCNYQEFDELNSELLSPSDFGKWHGLKTFSERGETSEEFKKHFLRLNPVPWRKIYRKSLLNDDVRFPVGDYFFEDNPFHWETTIKAAKISFSNFIGCYHRINRPGQTMSTSNAKLLAMYEHHSTILSGLKESPEPEKFKDQSIGWLVGNTEWITRKIGNEHLKSNYKAFRSELKKYGQDSVDETLSRIHVGNRGRDLVRFALSGSYHGFKIAATESEYKRSDHLKISLKEKGLARTVINYSNNRMKPLLNKSSAAEITAQSAIDKAALKQVSTDITKEINVLRNEIARLNGDLRAIKMAMILEKED